MRGGATPLLFAARVGDAESARLLLKAGADANDSQPDGVSALVLAAHSGNGNVAPLLLEHGADPNAVGTGYTALHAAILRSDLNLYGKGIMGPNVRFAASGLHTIQVQVREDGFSIDQIVLSAKTDIAAPPGLLKDDRTILPQCANPPLR